MTSDIATLQAILKQKETEIEVLTISEARYKHLYDQSPIAIFITDRDGRMLDMNQAGLSQLGYTLPMDKAKRITDFLANADESRRYQKQLEEEGSLIDFQTRITDGENQVRHVQISVVKREGVTGKLDGYEGFMLDVTERNRIEAELRSSEEKHQMVLDSSQAGIYMFQDGGLLKYVNPRLLEMMGFGAQEDIIGRPFWEFVHPEDRESVKHRGLSLEKHDSVSTDNTFRLCQKDGQVIWVDLFAIQVSYEGKPTVVGNLIDITRLKQSEDEIRQLTQKLIQAIEDERKYLAADLHDEFGQALTTLQFDIKLIEQNLAQEDMEQRDRCRQTMERIRELARHVRAISSRLRPDLLDHMGLVTSIQTQVDLFNERLNKPCIQFITDLENRRMPPSIELAIYRIFQEALNNAIKHAGADRVEIDLNMKPTTILLTIRDNGSGFEQNESGLPVNLVEQGIGLMSMKERVASLQGTIRIHSSRSDGTTIRVELPHIK